MENEKKKSFLKTLKGLIVEEVSQENSNNQVETKEVQQPNVNLTDGMISSPANLVGPIVGTYSLIFY